MSEDSDVEKTEPASEQRLRKAREEGQIARSKELNTCLLLLAGAGTLWATAHYVFDRLTLTVKAGMTFDWLPRHGFGESRGMSLAIVQGAADGIVGLAPLFAVLIVVAIGASVSLGGFVFSAKSFEPKFSRLSPLAGLKRMLSAQMWMELLKTLLKAGLVGGVGILTIKAFLPEMLNLNHLTLHHALADGMYIVAASTMTVIASLVVLALIDVPWQMYSHAKKMRMSKEEVGREHKDNEGDPHVKGRIRQQQREASRRRMMSDVPTADVVVTNPTHYSVALRYEKEGSTAPTVVAKGRGAIAARIREIAEENRIPLLEAPPLARALYAHTEVGEPIPEVLYIAVAQVLAWVFQLKAWREGQGAPPERPGSLPIPTELDPNNKFIPPTATR